MSAIEEHIANAVSKVFPEWGEMRGACIPLIASSKGHIGSTVCQQLARELKRSPQEIAECLIPELQQGLQSEVVFDEGFINFHFSSDEWHLLSRSESELQSSHTVFLSPGVDTLTPIEFLRLSALASMQLLHLLSLGVKPVLQFAGIRHQPGSAAAVMEFFLERLNSITSGSMEACGTHEAAEEALACLQQGGGPRTLWLAPRSLARKKYNDLFKEYASKATTFCCPPRSFLAASKRESLSPLREAAPAAVLLYLCSGIPSSDIDPFVPALKEKSNLYWFAASLMERARKLGLTEAVETVFDLPIVLEDLSADQQELLILVAQQVRMSFLAATAGRVLECTAAQGLLLESFGNALNRPDVRIGLESGTISAHERKIITSVLKSVSDIMLVWNS